MTTAALILGLLIVALLIAVFCYWRWRARLGRGLALDDWEVFFLPGCQHCTAQAAVLDLGFKGFKRRITCGGVAPPAACAKVPAFPFWRNARTGATRTGFQNFTELQAMARKK